MLIGPAPGVAIGVAAGSWADAGIPKPPHDQASFLQYLERTGQPTHSKSHHYPASFATFHDYKLLVYGTPAQVPNNRYSQSHQQYAMLGFSYDERPVTNTLFPDDAPGGITQTNPFSWSELDLGSAASASWQRLSTAQRRLLQSAQLYYRNNPYGYMDYAGLGLSERRAIVLAPPSWHLGSALYTEHYLQRGSTRERRYATFTCNGGGGAELDCQIEVLTPADRDQAYAFTEGSDELRIAYRVTGHIRALTGLARDQDIVLRGVGTEDGHAYGSGMGPFVYEGVRVLNRSLLAGSSAGVAEIRATAFVVSAMGDIVQQEQVRYLPLRSQKAIEPLVIQATLSGAIGYFSGARTLAGRTPAASGRRFLGLETVWLTVRFNKPVSTWSHAFDGVTRNGPVADGQMEYRVPIQMPLGRDTLGWQDNRLQPALALEIRATDPEAPDRDHRATLTGIELTGDIYDLIYLQPAA